ncbi:MAG TPA: TVP38/TMEM64 family protein [Longimicrobiaceae bacterium]|nr:TVP38/TMEM64 family protein [Longimicrobiaceae bacterium]
MRLQRLLVFVVALLVVFLLARRAGGYLPEFATWIADRGAWGVAAFILGYAVATVAAIPGSILTLAAGAIFGIAEGTAYVFVGAVLGSSAAFLIARYLARPLVERKVASDPRFVRIDRTVGQHGWKIVGLLRLSPLLPYNLLNYALGLTAVAFRDYLIGAIGMLPGTLLYVYSGRVAGELVVLAGGGDVERGTGYYAVLAVGLLATIVATVWIGRISKRALSEAA